MAPRLHHCIDQPPGLTLASRCVLIRGWAYEAPARAVSGIRLSAGGRTLTGVVGLPRPDVKVAFPDAPSDNTGFEIRGTLPGGTFTARIEARLGDLRWVPLEEQCVKIPRRYRPVWLGGGDPRELIFFQMPAHMAYPPRPVRAEKFPPVRAGGRRPKLSIVTPSYQQAAFLEETITSVVEQETAVEYVVQDGGSTDGSVEIIRCHAPRLHAWASERDAGQADAIVRGFARTSGTPEDVMAWINSDDYYLPGALPFVADYFARHPAADVIYGHRIVVDEHSQEIARWFLPRHDPGVLRLNDFVPQETLFWRRRIWNQLGGLDRAFQFAMDWDLLLRFQEAGANIVRLPYFLGCFRVRDGQKTSARMHDIGQREIELLRTRAQGRPVPAAELEIHPRLLRYLRRSALIADLWSWGIRVP